MIVDASADEAKAMKLTPAFVALPLLLAGCGGGSNSSGTTQQPPPPPPSPVPTLDPQYRVSAATPFAPNCDGVPASGTLYANAEVEPALAINPANTSNIVAAWQQDRWSNGGARGIVAATSIDGGHSWAQRAMAFSRCGGGDYERASDPWLSAAPDGTLHQIAIAFSGGLLQPGSVSAVLASRSTDGGATWSPTRMLIRDTGSFFNDKCTITADTITPHYVYAVWDRLVSETSGPTAFARSSDDGATWSTARTIYDLGPTSQTISNQIVVLPNGMLVNLFLQIDTAANNTFTSALKVIRSSDNGDTWSAPFKIADNFAVGTRDPDTGTGVRDGSLVPQIAVAPGGDLYVVWQDARFSNGARDGIALSRSSDGGMTWSAPVRVNGDVTVAAFVPSVHVRADGQVGVSYFDFRQNTSSPATLLTSYWLARSSGGTSWSESQIAGPFDLALAPLSVAGNTAEYFLGDYQALLGSGNVFVPLFAQTNAAGASNRSDVFLAPAVSATASVAAVAHVQTAQNFVVTADLVRRVSDNLARAREAPPRARASARRASQRH
jgi:hypothetical protein